MRWALPLALVVATALAQIVRCSEPAPPVVLDETALPRSVTLATDDAPRSIEDLRRRVAEVLERERVPGVAIALVGRDGPLWIGGVGVADTNTRVPVTGDTVFRVASITKSIVALGVMRLVEQERLDLDRPLADTLRDVPIDNAWDDVAPVTLAQVLEHTAGLDDMRPNEVFVDDDAMAPAAALAINPRSRTIRWRPGSRPAYSNVGYGLAGRAIEIATGEPFDAWLRREVLQPIGMRDADFRRTDTLGARLATGYHDDRAMRFRPIAHRPAGSLLASATDLAKLVEFWLRRGEGFASVVSPTGLRRIERSGTVPYPGTDVDYGLGNYGDVGHPYRSRGHDGGLPGFVSSFRYFPDLGTGYVILLNATHSFTAWLEIRRLVYAYLVRDRAVATAPPAASPAAGPSAEFYGFASPRHELFGFLERAVIGFRAIETRGRVTLDPLVGSAVELVPTRDGAYKVAGQSGSSIRFTHDRDGIPVMIGAAGYNEAGSWWPAHVRTVALAIALVLLQIAPLWSAATILLCAMRRRTVPLDLVLAPAIAGLCVMAIPRLLVAADLEQVIGEVHPLTIGLCATTIVFAIAAGVGLRAALRWSVRPDRPSLLVRFVPSVTAIAAFVLTAWLGANGIIGLRTWAW